MIARTWHGVTQSSKADAYVAYLKESGLKEYRETPGNRGITVLRRTEGDRGALPAHFLLDLARSDPTLRRSESRPRGLLSKGQRVPSRTRADRLALRCPRITRRRRLASRPRRAYGGWETVALSRRDPARIVIPSPMMLDAIRAPSS